MVTSSEPLGDSALSGSEPLPASASPAQPDAEAKAQNGASQSEADVIEKDDASSSNVQVLMSIQIVVLS